MPLEMSCLKLRQQLDLSRKCAGIMETVCVTGGPWHWGSQPCCYFEWAKQGSLLRSERRQMPMDLTVWPTSVPSQLLNDQIWYLTLWSGRGLQLLSQTSLWRGVDSLSSSSLVFIFREWNEKTTEIPSVDGRWSWQAWGSHCQWDTSYFNIEGPKLVKDLILSHYSLHCAKPNIYSDLAPHKM